MKFKNKIVLITWSSRWIWMATALHFWKEWATVIVNYLNSEDNAIKVVDSIKKLWWNSIAIKCDVWNENEVISMVNLVINTFWRIDILINNAWIIVNEPILSKTVKQWNSVINTNLLWTFLCSKYVVETMLKNNNWWTILNISSINWSKYFSPDEIDYDISKAWINVLTKNFAKAYSPKIRVFAIAPWNVSTEINWWKLDFDDERKIYLKKYHTPSEIWKIILNLLYDDSMSINWDTIFIDWD